MFEQTFKNIDDILHKDAGCGSELDYVEQTSWVLFLKYLEDMEQDRETAAQLPKLIELKYHTITDATNELGGVDEIRSLFLGFQKHLYEENTKGAETHG